jgi:hypothetical protein
MLLLFLLWFFCNPSVSSALYWQELKGDHFIIKYTDNKKYAQEVITKSECHYTRIADRLGYARYTDFWTWNNRVVIYIYPDHTSYLQSTGQMEWSEARADYRKKEISMYMGNQIFLETVLPHEIAHLIFRDFVGFKGEVPLWLDEGVAISRQEEATTTFKKQIKELYDRSALLTLKDMTTLDFKNESSKTSFHHVLMKDNSKGYVLMQPNDFIAVFYAESASIVNFLIENYGLDRFTEFCRQLRDGKKLDEALRKTYTQEIPDIDHLEKKWREYISQ